MEGNGGAKTMIDSQVEIIGTIKTAGSIQLDGKLQGDLQCGGDVTIGKSANIKGNLSVNSCSVAGQVTGNITAKDRIEMKSSARVMGDIRAKRLHVEDGVTFVGKSEVNPGGPTGAPPAPAGNEPNKPQGGQGQPKDDKGGLFKK